MMFPEYAPVDQTEPTDERTLGQIYRQNRVCKAASYAFTVVGVYFCGKVAPEVWHAVQTEGNELFDPAMTLGAAALTVVAGIAARTESQGSLVGGVEAYLAEAGNVNIGDLHE